MYDAVAVLDHYGLLGSETELSTDSLKVRCPFHSESVASMNVDLRRGLLYCFGCGWKGDLVALAAEIEGIDRLQAMIRLIKVAKLHIGEKVSSRSSKSKSDLLFSAWLQYTSAPVPNWYDMPDHYMVEKRRFAPDILSRFDIRIEPGSENYPIIIPVRDNGRFIGLLRRRIDSVDRAKYVHSRGFGKKTALGGTYVMGPVMVVEGMFDMMKAVQFGYSNVACLFGWKASKAQVQKLLTFTSTVISALDNTPTGREGNAILRQHFRVIEFEYPEHSKDICDMSRHEFMRAMLNTKEKWGNNRDGS